MVTRNDRALLSRYRNGSLVLSDAAAAAADLNGDGAVTEEDAAMLKRML